MSTIEDPNKNKDVKKSIKGTFTNEDIASVREHGKDVEKDLNMLIENLIVGCTSYLSGKNKINRIKKLKEMSRLWRNRYDDKFVFISNHLNRDDWNKWIEKCVKSKSKVTLEYNPYTALEEISKDYIRLTLLNLGCREAILSADRIAIEKMLAQVTKKVENSVPAGKNIKIKSKDEEEDDSVDVTKIF